MVKPVREFKNTRSFALEEFVNDSPEIRMSVSGDTRKVVLYVPYNTGVRVDMDLSGYDWTLVNLDDKLFAKPAVKVENRGSVIKMHDFNSDVLIIGTR